MDRDPQFVEYQIANLVWSVLAPVLLIIGLAGNILSFLTLMRPILKPRVSSLYFRALCIADSCALLFGLLPIWPLYLVGYDFTGNNKVLCKLRNFLFILFSDCSIWMICAFTFDRLVAVAFPLRRKMICTHKRAMFSISFIWVLSVVKNISILVTWDIRESNTTRHVSKCGIPDKEYVFYDEYVRPWLVFTTVTVIPFVFITTCNMIIVHNLKRMRTMQAAIGRVQCGLQTISDNHIASMTRMCLTVSFTFVILVTPSIILLIGKPYWTTTPHSTARFHLARSFGNLCQYTNNAINFLLYFSSGREFRRELHSMCIERCSCKERRERDSVMYSYVDTTL